jgi:hypothetical protein
MTSLRTYLFLGVVLALVFGTTRAQAQDYFDPVGSDGRADCTRLAGWAKDGDTTLPIQVHVYKGGPFPYGIYVTAVVADLYRSDLPFADKNHGYSIPTPSAFFTGCPETVYVHAIDVDVNGNIVPGGNNILLNNTGKTVSCGTPDPSCFSNPGPPSQQ